MLIKIDRYEVKVDTKGVIHYYAKKGKETIEMSPAYKEMYNDNYLAIKERTLTMPELYGDGTPATHYIPIFTGVKND